MSKFTEAVLERANQPRLCKVGALRVSMTLEDQDALDYAVANVRKDAETAQPARVFTIAWLTQVLNDNGYDIGKTAVGDHLREVCACYVRK